MTKKEIKTKKETKVEPKEAKTATKKATVPKVAEEKVVKEKVETVEKVEKKTRVSVPRDLDEVIYVKSIAHGKLNFINSQGLLTQWGQYGDVMDLTYRDLMHMASSSRRFFEEPWVIMDEDVLRDLRMEKYYQHIIDYDNIDSIFTYSPEKLKDTLDKMTDGTKRLIADRASHALNTGTLDSMAVIRVLEESLKVDLV